MKMQITPFGKFLAGIVGILIVATSVCVTVNVQAQRRTKQKPPAVQKLTVALTEKGYEPSNLKLRRDIPARVTFIRQVSATCATQILLPDFAIKRDLPLNAPVLVEFTPKKSGQFTFTCGMGMLKGSLLVR